jgi:hypothetical protein
MIHLNAVIICSGYESVRISDGTLRDDGGQHDTIVRLPRRCAVE